MDNLTYQLAKPLLIMKEKQGILACGYINVETCNATGEAAAIVRGVNNYDDMRKATVVAVSTQAQQLGVKIGDTGAQALEKMA